MYHEHCHLVDILGPRPCSIQETSECLQSSKLFSSRSTSCVQISEERNVVRVVFQQTQRSRGPTSPLRTKELAVSQLVKAGNDRTALHSFKQIPWTAGVTLIRRLLYPTPVSMRRGLSVLRVLQKKYEKVCVGRSGYDDTRTIAIFYYVEAVQNHYDVAFS